MAGNTPKNIPMTEDITKVTITENRLIDAGKKILITRTIRAAKISPIVPPKIESIKDSVRN